MARPWTVRAPRSVIARGDVRRTPSRRVPRVLLRLVVVLALLMTAVSWEGADLALHPPAMSSDAELAHFPALARIVQDVSFPSRPVRGHGAVRLVGRFFPGRSRAAIILTHGLGPDQNQMLPWANFLHRAGYSVLTYDTRSRGGSGGAAATLGALEQDDALGAVDYIVSRRDVDHARIGALGVSLGAVVTILAAARDRRIRAVVADSAFSDADSAISSAIMFIAHVPARPFAALTVAIAEARAGVSVDTVRPVDVVARISPRPILVIHGLADTYIPPANSARLYAAARAPKEIWRIAGAAHTGGYGVAGSAYERRVAGFFQRSLGS